MSAAEMSDDDLVASWAIVCRAVARTHERVLQDVQVEGDSAAWFPVLRLLLQHSEHRLPMTHLARELSMTTGGFTKLADRMGREGLIDRRNSTDDRRVVYATLTDSGLALAERSDRQYRAALREHVFDVLSPAHLAALADGAAVLSAAQAAAQAPTYTPSVAASPVQPPAPAPRGDRPERRRRTPR